MNIATRTNSFEGTNFDPEYLVDERKTSSIFVSIIGENEGVYDTIESLYNNARDPGNLFVSCTIGIVGHGFQNYIGLEPPINHPNLRISYVPTSYVALDGKEKNYIYDTYGKLRMFTDSKYNNETYFMTIGSDMRFDPDWDIVLLKQYQSLAEFDSKVLLTAFPRAYLPHDNETEGFKFYMNHKEMTTLQREEYDGARYPSSGIMENSTMVRFLDSTEGIQKDEELDEFYDELQMHKDFLFDNGFPLYYGLKFKENEVIAKTNALSLYFLFGKAKDINRINKASEKTLSIHEDNFKTTLKFFKEGFSFYSMRWTPIYKHYGSRLFLTRTGIDWEETKVYEDSNFKDTESYKEIKEIVDSFIDSKDEKLIFDFNTFFGIDWEGLVFKTKTHRSKNSLVNLINSMISMYSFSTQENSLHWNKRYVK
jgi:hypothetical protein